MATLGEYGSLLQLGFGIGIGLSIFRAPMDLLSISFEKDLRAELDVFEGVQTTKAKTNKSDLGDLSLEFAQTAEALNSFHLPFMIAAIAGALVNWGLLAWASNNAGRRALRWGGVGSLHDGRTVFSLDRRITGGCDMVLDQTIQAQTE